MRHHAGLARYLDLRVWYDAQRDDFYTCHALRGTSSDDVLDAVGKFTSVSRKEIVLLDFNHFYAFATPALHQRLVTKITSRLGAAMLDSSAGVDVTVQDVWNRNKNVIAFYNDSAVVSGNSLFWPASKLDSPWPNQERAADLKNWLQTNVIGKPHPNFWVLQGVITPDWKLILGGIFTRRHCAISSATSTRRWSIGSRHGRKQCTGLNIVMLDFTNLCRLVPAVIAVNR